MTTSDAALHPRRAAVGRPADRLSRLRTRSPPDLPPARRGDRARRPRQGARRRRQRRRPVGREPHGPARPPVRGRGGARGQAEQDLRLLGPGRRALARAGAGQLRRAGPLDPGPRGRPDGPGATGCRPDSASQQARLGQPLGSRRPDGAGRSGRGLERGALTGCPSTASTRTAPPCTTSTRTGGTAWARWPQRSTTTTVKLGALAAVSGTAAGARLGEQAGGVRVPASAAGPGLRPRRPAGRGSSRRP